jgi:hypothetical protein
VTRGTDPRHARRMRLQVTPLGFEVLRTGEAIFDELRDQWERQVGPAELENLETHLAELAGTPPVRFDTPGWMSRDLGEPVWLNRPARLQRHWVVKGFPCRIRGRARTQDLGGWSSVSSWRASGRPAPWGKYSAWLARTAASGTALGGSRGLGRDQRRLLPPP